MGDTGESTDSGEIMGGQEMISEELTTQEMEIAREMEETVGMVEAGDIAMADATSGGTVETSSGSNPGAGGEASPKEKNGKMKLQKIHSYFLGKTLGQGAYGTVRLCAHEKTKKKFAVKIVNKSMISKDCVFAARLKREIGILKVLDHPCLNRMVDVFQSKEHLYMVLEFVPGGNLFTFVNKHCTGGKAMDFVAAFSIFYQITSGLEHCHKHCICHRDIKLENVLLSQFDPAFGVVAGAVRAQLADFGLSNTFESQTPFLQTRCGSPHYAPPEVVKGGTYNARQSDVWSLGVVAYTLFVGRMPFLEPDVAGVLRKILKGEFHIPPQLESDVADMLKLMMTVDPSKRGTIEQIKETPFWQRGCSLCDFDPEGWHTNTDAPQSHLTFASLSNIPQMQTITKVPLSSWRKDSKGSEAPASPSSASSARSPATTSPSSRASVVSSSTTLNDESTSQKKVASSTSCDIPRSKSFSSKMKSIFGKKKGK